MNITQNPKDRIYSIRGGMNSYGPYLDGCDIRDAFHYQHGRFYRQNGWDGKSAPKLEWEHSREQVEQAQTCQGWAGLAALLDLDKLDGMLYPLARDDIGSGWHTLFLPLADDCNGLLHVRVRRGNSGQYLFHDEGQLIDALAACDRLPWNHAEELHPLLAAHQVTLQGGFLVRESSEDEEPGAALADLTRAMLVVCQHYGMAYRITDVPENLHPGLDWQRARQQNNHALWQRLHLRQPEFVTGGVFCLATANAQNRCEFLELLCDLATAEDCRDVWDYFHGHPLASVRTFHQRLCVEFVGVDYDDPVVQDDLTRLMREVGMYGWLVMGQVAMPEDADDWHSGFAYAETFEQAMADILQWAERAREARA